MLEFGLIIQFPATVHIVFRGYRFSRHFVLRGQGRDFFLRLPSTMYITKLILEGFKSYATRTVIDGFDPNFNAITGLNGSGKSNILDAICFVLGISNLSQVRVSSLQELVYKNGQAGVTKASVSVVFNNEDKSRSPVGFESLDEITVTRQVVIGGRNKVPSLRMHYKLKI